MEKEFDFVMEEEKYITNGKELILFIGDDIPSDYWEVTLDEWEEIKPKFEHKEDRIIDTTKVEIREIKRWFKETDYIELQASRGTITRDSDKYIQYLEEYNEKLQRLNELE